MNNKKLLDQTRNKLFDIANKVSRAESQQDINMYTYWSTKQQELIMMCDEIFGKGWQQ